MDLLRRFLGWRLPFRWKVDAEVRSVLDVDDTLTAKTAVLVRADGHSKWLVFDCPCSGHHRVMVNLNPEIHPAWRIDQQNPLSIRPSVDERSPGRHCHYVVHNGHIRWVERTEPKK